MWEMQVLSSQRNNNNKGDDAGGGSASGPEFSGEDRLNGESTDMGPESTQDEHPALRGVQPGTPSSSTDTAATILTTIPMNNGSGLPSPPNGLVTIGVGGCRSNIVPNGGASPVQGVVSQAAVAAAVTGGPGGVGAGGRKRPLLAGGLRTSMTPTKRTVMSLLARARAAQAKQLPATFSRVTPERTTTLVPLLREDYLTGAVNLNLI